MLGVQEWTSLQVRIVFEIKCYRLNEYSYEEHIYLKINYTKKKLVADDHGYKWKIKRQIFLEDNLRDYFHDFREGKDFLGQKKKTLILGIELNYIQIKNVHLSNTSKKNENSSNKS